MSARASFVVEIPPGHGRINGRFVVAWSRKSHRPPRLVKSKQYRGFVQEVAAAAGLIAQRGPRFHHGRVGVSVTVYWPTLDHVTPSIDGEHPRGDVDAIAKSTLDGIEAGGLIDNDARVVELHMRKRWDPKRPRVAVLVYTVPDSA